MHNVVSQCVQFKHTHIASYTVNFVLLDPRLRVNPLYPDFQAQLN